MLFALFLVKLSALLIVSLLGVMGCAYVIFKIINIGASAVGEETPGMIFAGLVLLLAVSAACLCFLYYLWRFAATAL